ncbi:recombinase family protein [Burkholderia ubonensis]|uniref:recombinase family protein n=1 Tax=Burkholderia ubonensis TaxID=101571 RepID=UPI0038F5F1E8
MSRIFAYARVSTTDQTPANQLREIEAAGFTVDKRRVITESISGSVSADQRPGFAELLLKMEEGDVLIVTKLDRLGRNAMDVRATVEALRRAVFGFIASRSAASIQPVRPVGWDLSVISWARHIMRGKSHGYANEEETNGSIPGSGPRAAA